MRPPSPQTTIHYLYRDAANFKAFGQFRVVGDVPPEAIAEIHAKLEGGVGFVAEQVRIPPLYRQLYRHSRGQTADDHAFHELVAILPTTPADRASSRVLYSAARLLGLFRRVTCWDVTCSPHGAVWFDGDQARGPRLTASATAAIPLPPDPPPSSAPLPP